MTLQSLTIVEVGPRDGFQPILQFIPTDTKISVIRDLYDAGLRRIEAAAFVSEAAVPQMRDAAAVLSAAQGLAGLDAQVLAPNARHAERAVQAGARHVAFVLSASEAHNRSNVRRSPRESAADYRDFVARLPADVRIRVNLATSFDCPFRGEVPAAEVFSLLDELVAARPNVEVALCDTTGRVTPDRVHALFAQVRDRYPASTTWVFHGHDTYGLGVANVLAAYMAGVRIVDAAVGGLGGCPFAPGATGNVATEDVVWTFSRMGVETGVDLPALLAVAGRCAALPGAQSGGRVRVALAGGAAACPA